MASVPQYFDVSIQKCRVLAVLSTRPPKNTIHFVPHRSPKKITVELECGRQFRSHICRSDKGNEVAEEISVGNDEIVPLPGAEEKSFDAVMQNYLESKQKLKQFVSNSENEFYNPETLLKVRNYQETVSTRAGTLFVRPLTALHLGEAVELLTDSFLDLSGITYRPLLRLQVKVYLQQRLLQVPHSVVLIGMLQQNGDLENSGSPIIVGTVELSLSPKSKPQFLTLNPPSDSPYLCNMSVLPAVRRKGVGTALIDCAEDLCRNLGQSKVYLHCRLCDEVPFSMYSKAGYVVEDTDNFLASAVLFQKRRHLMVKFL